MPVDGRVRCRHCPVCTAVADDNPTVYRVFLKDGTSFVSDGEPARVNDGVVFSDADLGFRQRSAAPAREPVPITSDWD
jgi:hypothetical protein